MNKSQTITAIFERHGAAFNGLTSTQCAAVFNAMGAAYEAGNQARPDYSPPEPPVEHIDPTLAERAKVFERDFSGMSHDEFVDWLTDKAIEVAA